jgi:hypothetical protein
MWVLQYRREKFFDGCPVTGVDDHCDWKGGKNSTSFMVFSVTHITYEGPKIDA